MTGTCTLSSAMASIIFLPAGTGPGVLPFAVMTKRNKAVIAFPTMSGTN